MKLHEAIKSTSVAPLLISLYIRVRMYILAILATH